jgi:hydrogenase nickel incorporation protein HypA/HybF
MHESSLAKQIFEAALASAQSSQANKVVKVSGWLAETERLSAESLQMHFDLHAAGTIAEGAKLDLVISHVLARCDACGDTYPPEHHVTICPACGCTDATRLGRVGLGVDSVEVE